MNIDRRITVHWRTSRLENYTDRRERNLEIQWDISQIIGRGTEVSYKSRDKWYVGDCKPGAARAMESADRKRHYADTDA